MATNRTLDERDKPQKLTMNFDPEEEYRFTFLYHLRTVKTMLELGNEAKDVAKIQAILKDEKSRKDSHDDCWSEIIKAGDALFFRYQMDYSLSSFESAANQLYAELMVVRKQEERLFKELLRLVQTSHLTDSEESASWFFNSAKKQRNLLVMDSLSADRIKYYKTALAKFSEKPLSPYKLEASFRALHGGLAHLAR